MTVLQRQLDAVQLRLVRDFDAAGRYEDDGAVDGSIMDAREPEPDPLAPRPRS